MPNFHTHWLVALQALDSLKTIDNGAFKPLVNGRDNYVSLSVALGAAVDQKVAELVAAKKPDPGAAANLPEFIKGQVKKWEAKLRDDEDAICFSAYMLGACGPDFWTLPSETWHGTVPDTAGVHFDLGHYNRTHLMFEVSLAELQRLGKAKDAQTLAEKAYFLGMATHFGGDLVLHELVNVYAGAYNLLKMGQKKPYGVWSNEQGYEFLSPSGSAQELPPPPADASWWSRNIADPAARAGTWVAHGVGEGLAKPLGDIAWIWTTHNKVEHYWDTWVRYRWLGDFGNRIWERGDVELSPVFKPLRLPLCDTIRRQRLGTSAAVRGLGSSVAHQAGAASRAMGRIFTQGENIESLKESVRQNLDHALGSVETRALLEKPLAFPWLFCDSVLQGGIAPFIYDRVVDKKRGAYPEALLFKGARIEADSPQMNAPAVTNPADRSKPTGPGPATGKCENRKLQYFSSKRNEGFAPTSWNYLNYITCPDLGRLRQFGADVFYDRAAFPPFVAKATEVARKFTGDLGSAYQAGRTTLRELGHFWNLDTGLGLRIQNVTEVEGAKMDRHEVVTRIDWVHVLGPVVLGSAIPYTQSPHPPYAESRPAATPPLALEWSDALRPFPTYRAKFPRLGEVVEEQSVTEERTRKYLDRLRLENPLVAGRSAPIFKRLEDLKPQAVDDKAFEDALFEKDAPWSGGCVHQVPSGKEAQAKVAHVEHRLDLEIRASIARLHDETEGDLAMYLLGDKEPGDKRDPVKEGQEFAEDRRELEAATKWLLHRSKVLDRVIARDKDPASDKADLATFSTRIIVNLVGEELNARVVDLHQWNNVIPFKAHKDHYGRNFAIATARKNVLRSDGADSKLNDFNPLKDFKSLRELGLTEHCFFTVYPLVRLGDTWWDAFTRKPVGKEAFLELKKLDAINFVKIVLLYVVAEGALQLDWCYVDGVRLRVQSSVA